ncbi:hypothetical protein BH11ACT3_BH11ACT3_24320 [soil metagenome]
MGMTSRQARRARAIAREVLSYRAWASDPMFGVIPSIAVLSDPRLHVRQADWQLRRAANGVFDATPRTLVA